jgi:hypothetical protein
MRGFFETHGEQRVGVAGSGCRERAVVNGAKSVSTVAMQDRCRRWVLCHEYRRSKRRCVSALRGMGSRSTRGEITRVYSAAADMTPLSTGRSPLLPVRPKSRRA